jgi:uncharacterized DUF497 family protein
VVNERLYQFEWDEAKAALNEHKHGVTFEFASSVFYDPRLLTAADVEHSETEERWSSIGVAPNGVLLSVVYIWSEAHPEAVNIRLISARRATPAEVRQYEEGS